MKVVIFSEAGRLKVTTEANYKAFVRNARQVQDCGAFGSAEEIITYYCEYFHSKPEDFVVV